MKNYSILHINFYTSILQGSQRNPSATTGLATRAFTYVFHEEHVWDPMLNDEEEEQSNINKANDGGDLAFQLVDGNCKYNIMGMNDFERKVNLSQRGRSYAVVAIMGPQSSGKSTLLNHLFGTSFKEMNEEDGRHVILKFNWFKDIGLYNAANVPRLKTAFEQSSPEEKLEAQLKENIQKVEVQFLPHYEYRLNDFKVEVEKLKQRFVNSTTPGGLVGDQKDSACVMMATIRCDEIKEEKYDSFEKNERRDNFFKRDFGKIVNSILNTCLSKYDEDTAHFHEATRKNKREELEEKLLKCVEPVYLHNMTNLRLEYLRTFMEAIDRTSIDEQNTFARFADGCMKDCLQEFKKDCEATKIDLADWHTSEAYYAKLEFLMRKHICAKGEARVDSKIERLYEPDLKLKLLDGVRYLLCEETDPTWSKVRKHLKNVTKSTIYELNVTLSEFSIDEEGRKKRIEGINNYVKEIKEAKAQEESHRAKERMMTNFSKFSRLIAIGITYKKLIQLPRMLNTWFWRSKSIRPYGFFSMGQGNLLSSVANCF
ncbi:hypothetical protein L6164_003036 [Bauhinia variegata]|uniref:Uncharacterized protein n=1 Tax=Bauhinia variegata TaxID=167791 RepID=A0ACB9Q019_BAUVA|nr:hypothetical protein L6164_003036 [Bauhinia variegata]